MTDLAPVAAAVRDLSCPGVVRPTHESEAELAVCPRIVPRTHRPEEEPANQALYRPVVLPFVRPTHGHPRSSSAGGDDQLPGEPVFGGRIT